MSELCSDCKNARMRFRYGDKVILSTLGCARMPSYIRRKSVGKVVGFCRSRLSVKILINGQKRPQRFYSLFWERP